MPKNKIRKRGKGKQKDLGKDAAFGQNQNVEEQVNHEKLFLRLRILPQSKETGESSKISETYNEEVSKNPATENTSLPDKIVIRLPKDVFEAIAEINRKRPLPNPEESSEDEQPAENINLGRGRFRLENAESMRRSENQHNHTGTFRMDDEDHTRRREYQRNYQRQRRQGTTVSRSVI